MLIAFGLERELLRYQPTDVILQFTNQMWNASRFGTPAPTWLANRIRKHGTRVVSVVHEPYIPSSLRPDLAVAALAQRVQLLALLRVSDRVYLTTETRVRAIAPLCRLAGVADPKVIRIGPNAMPAVRMRRQDQGSGWAPRIGYFSTASVGRRFDIAIEAFATISREFPSSELVLMGDLGPADRPSVKAIVDSISGHPARARIRLTGRLPLSEIAAEMADLDLYLFPMNTGANTRSSTLPTALGSSLPIVSVRGPETDLGLFRDGENIVFARDLTAAAFAEASLLLLKDPAALKRIGGGARQLYDDHLSWSRIADTLLAG
jgi:glycosyltransferase involved in cell wall biosynthesis